MTRGPRSGAALTAVHLVVLVAGLSLAAYAASKVVAGTGDWLRVAVWFAGAVVLHDLVAFPVYAAADRVLTAAVTRGAALRNRVPPVNHVRVPALGSLLLLAVFLPQIGGQGDGGFSNTSGLRPGPFLLRWVVTSAVLFALSAVLYAARLLVARPSTRAPAGDR